ncbi:MAG TPA: DUF5808 domain-containing protein [Prolixibacteraceae bacterium]|nr:DUF5808 domain-containing protein [Prolixibacteraceae bacterium]
MNVFDDPTSNSKNYKWGFFYFNKADPRIFVPKRYGFGYSLNFGKPYVTVGFILILLIILYQAFFN